MSCFFNSLMRIVFQYLIWSCFYTSHCNSEPIPRWYRQDPDAIIERHYDVRSAMSAYGINIQADSKVHHSFPQGEPRDNAQRHLGVFVLLDVEHD